MKTEIFRWSNCRADIDSVKHELTIRAFLRDVVRPAVASLEARIEELKDSDEPAACFIQADMKMILSETKKAFALSVQSIWERQIRSYLCMCAAELQPQSNLASKVPKADWTQLSVAFETLRGIPLNEFPSFPRLDTLQLLGNACRHGDGPAAIELSKRHREWWPVYTPMPSAFGVTEPPPLVVASMDIPIDSIVSSVEAICEFWRDMGYIYHESIARKHPSLEARLVLERQERGWLHRLKTAQQT